MKKLFLFISAFTFGNVYSQTEWVSASVGNGGSVNTVSVFIETNTAFDANKCDNLVFTVRIPVSAGAAVGINVTATDPAFGHLTFFVQKINVTDGLYYYYLVNGTGNVNGALGTIIPVSMSFKVLDLTFTGTGSASSVVELVNIENDIIGNDFIWPQFFIQTNAGDITNQSSMFYGTAGAVPVNNQLITNDDWVGTSSAVLLPLQLINFKVRKNHDAADLTWTVANEDAQISRYEVERSVDGINFKFLQSVSASHINSTDRSYRLTDNLEEIYSSVVYYRIRQVTSDERSVYSTIQSVASNFKQSASVYPNPVADISRMKLKLSQNSVIKVSIYDAVGKLIKYWNVNGKIGENYYPLNLKNLPVGEYNLRLKSGEFQETLKILKLH